MGPGLQAGEQMPQGQAHSPGKWGDRKDGAPGAASWEDKGPLLPPTVRPLVYPCRRARAQGTETPEIRSHLGTHAHTAAGACAHTFTQTAHSHRHPCPYVCTCAHCSYPRAPTPVHTVLCICMHSHTCSHAHTGVGTGSFPPADDACRVCCV